MPDALVRVVAVEREQVDHLSVLEQLDGEERAGVDIDRGASVWHARSWTAAPTRGQSLVEGGVERPREETGHP